MNSVFCSRTRNRGSALLFIAVILIVLSIIGISFSRQASDSRFMTRHHAQSMFLRSFAQAAAHLCLVKIQHEVAANPDHWLRAKFLARKMSAVTDTSNVVELNEYDELLAPMIEALEHEGDFAYEVVVSAQKIDFGPTHYSDLFPAEKSGHVRIAVKTILRGLREDYNFIAPVKVTSALIPALSRFNCYIRNAAPDGDDLYFNQVTNDFRGNLLGNATPLVLNNGSIAPHEVTWENLFNLNLGFVYLGGGDVRLNLSAATGQDVSDYGESFHFYRRSKPLPDTPFYLWEDRRNPPLNAPEIGPQPTLMLRFDLGVSEPGASDPLRNICSQAFVNAQQQYSAGVKEYRNSSILRLFGSDRNISPTLVLGKVYRGFVSISAGKVVPPGYPRNELFIFPTDLAEFNQMLSRHGQGQVARMLYPSPRTQAQLEEFRDNYASGIAYQPYNLSTGFYATRNEFAGPVEEIDKISPKLARSMSYDAEGRIANPETLELPEELAGLAGGRDLENMLDVFEEVGMQADSSQKSRFAWIIDMQNSANSSLVAELQQNGLMRNNELKLNGWLFIRNPPAELVIDRVVKVTGNGGIVIDKDSSLLIRGNVEGSRPAGPAFVMQLVVLQGNITVDCPRVDAALLAPKGKVSFLRKTEINGALIMDKLVVSDSFPGGTLNYNRSLAASPGDPKFAESLTFCFRTTPFLVN